MLVRVVVLLLGLSGLLSAVGAAGLAAPPAALPEAFGADQGKKSARESDFLVFGTVFDERGFAYHGAVVRVRRAGERQVRWEARSDHRGEFAVRVPRGAEYEMSVRATGYPELARHIDARAGSREDVVFRLLSPSGEKPK
jgi:hypothetical protein